MLTNNQGIMNYTRQSRRQEAMANVELVAFWLTRSWMRPQVMCSLNALPFLFVVSASKSMCIGFNPPLKVVWKRMQCEWGIMLYSLLLIHVHCIAPSLTRIRFESVSLLCAIDVHEFALKKRITMLLHVNDALRAVARSECSVSWRHRGIQ